MKKILFFFETLSGTCISIVKVILNSRYFSKAYFRKENNNREVIVFGNGPSLNATIEKSFEFIQSRDVICVNGFALFPVFTRIKPSYYVIADPGFWKKNFIPETDIFCKNVIMTIIRDVSWPMTFYIPYDAHKSTLISKISENKHIKVIFYNKTSVRGFRFFRHFCYRTNLGIPRAENVIIASLILAINMGYKKIYLTGADHSWHENIFIRDDNVLCVIQPHFYDKETTVTPIYENDTGKPVRISTWFNTLSLVFGLYWHIKEYAESVNAEIINISEKTYIDAFPRKKI